MHSGKLAAIAASLVLLGCVIAPAVPAPAQASTAGACSVEQARKDVKAAKRAYVRAAKRLREARHVLSATREYVLLYGPGVSRWTRLSRRVGWPWPQFPTLMYVINRESGGQPDIFNYQGSGAAGLLQFLPSWWSGKWDPCDPRQNLLHGRLAWEKSRWQPWGL